MQYKIELRMRNHNTLSRPTIIEELAKCVPEGHKVDLENPELFVLVEIWKVSPVLYTPTIPGWVVVIFDTIGLVVVISSTTGLGGGQRRIRWRHSLFIDRKNADLIVCVARICHTQSVCGIGIVKDYYKLQKFNVMEIAKSEEPGFKAGVAGTGRVQEKTKEKVEEGKEEEKKAGKEKEGSVQESDS